MGWRAARVKFYTCPRQGVLLAACAAMAAMATLVQAQGEFEAGFVRPELGGPEARRCLQAPYKDRTQL
jgi:hypothetical protein